MVFQEFYVFLEQRYAFPHFLDLNFVLADLARIRTLLPLRPILTDLDLLVQTQFLNQLAVFILHFVQVELGLLQEEVLVLLLLTLQLILPLQLFVLHQNLPILRLLGWVLRSGKAGDGQLRVLVDVG